MSSRKLAAATILLYIVMPVIFLAIGRPAVRLIIPSLLGVSIWCVHVLPQGSKEALWDLRPLKGCAGQIIARFALGAFAVAAATYAVVPVRFLALPRHHIRLWLLICLLYPLLSAFPQELIYRAFFFERAGQLISGVKAPWLLVLNAVVFGYAHIVFGNLWAPILAAAGGLLFASTYLRSRSVLCAAFEHALWGNLIFTVGLGPLFAGGTVANLLR